MKKIIWHPEERKVRELKLWKKNPRTITKEAFAKLKSRLQERGFHDVMVLDTEDNILSGNQRKKALLELGVEKVTVLVPSRPLTSEEKNKIALESNLNDGEWNFDALKTFSLDTLTDIGFDKAELDDIWTENLEVTKDDFDTDAELAKIKKTDIKRGDMFALGKHRLLCSDALDPNTVKKLMGGAKASMINDDLPFNIGLSYDRGVGNTQRYGGTTNDSKTDDEYKLFVKTIMQNALSVAKPDCHVLFWCDERFVYVFQMLYKELGVDSKRLLIWLKNNFSPTPSTAFNKAAEFCVYGTIGRPYLSKNVMDLNEVINKGLTTGNNLHDEVSDLFSVWLTRRLPSNQYSHPTQKNPSLHEKALRRCTRPGDIVLDLTAGSGSILSACEQLKRIAYVCDYEPIFCQLIINRFEKLTGLKAKKIAYEEK
jgi:DNA modification methylase